MFNKIVNSFYFAFSGIIYTLKSERNMKVHFFILAATIIMGVLFRLSMIEWCLIVVVSGMVIFAEMINTSIEAVVDLETSEIKPLAKIAKDVAAGAVLVTSIVAVIIGLVIFGSKILMFY